MAPGRGTGLNLSKKRLSAASQDRNHGKARIRGDTTNRDRRLDEVFAQPPASIFFFGREKPVESLLRL
jgi:hypothetical protein